MSAKQSLFKSTIEAKCLSTGLKLYTLLFSIDEKLDCEKDFFVKSYKYNVLAEPAKTTNLTLPSPSLSNKNGTAF